MADRGGSVFVALCVVLIVLGVAAHEVAHAVYFRHVGIKVKEMGFGLPLQPNVLIKSKHLPFPIRLSPWIVLAYVDVDEDQREKVEALPYSQYMHITCAGVMASWCVGLFYFALSLALARIRQPYWYLPFSLITIGAILLVIVLCVRFFQPICQRLMGYLSIVAALGTGVSIVLTGWLPILPPPHFSDYTLAIAFAGIVNVELAWFNLLPLNITDGGDIAKHWAMRRWGAKGWKVFTEIRTNYIFVVLIAMVWRFFVFSPRHG